MDDNVIALVGIICVFGLPIGGWITVRVLAHRERMAMLQNGMMPPPDARTFRRAGWNASPPPWTAPGPPAYDPAVAAQESLAKGVRTTAVGMALLIGLSFIGYHGGDGFLERPTFHPGPWLLGGLIPLFVGVAQIAVALLSGAQMSFRTPQMPPRPNSNGSAPPWTSAPFTPPPEARPAGTHYEELARPVPPPDRT